jgi:UDP-glucose 4-epimerase
LLQDISQLDNAWQIAILRYFNPVGAHPSGLIGERPCGIPNNLMPYVSQVASGHLQKLKIFGGNYDTPDGTGIRDYIHVLDLAKGHVQALNKLEKMKSGNVFALNLGTGKGYSVLDVIKEFKEVSGRKIPFEIVERRKGDVASCYSDPSLAKAVIDWSAMRGLTDMCRDTWTFQQVIDKLANEYKQ